MILDSQSVNKVDWKVAQVKKAMIESSDKLAVLTIAEKLNSTFKMKLCAPRNIDYLITELKPNDKKLTAYKKNIAIM